MAIIYSYPLNDDIKLLDELVGTTEKNINVDHIIPAGSLNTAQDLPLFVERLFCEQDNLQVLCTTCHDKKTLKEKQSKKKTI